MLWWDVCHVSDERSETRMVIQAFLQQKLMQCCNNLRICLAPAREDGAKFEPDYVCWRIIDTGVLSKGRSIADSCCRPRGQSVKYVRWVKLYGDY